MSSGLVLVNECDEPDIAEKSPRGRYIRYNEELGRGPNKVVVYKGFDEFDGSEVIWTKLSLDCDIFELEDCVDRLNKLLKPLKHDNIIKYYSSWVDNVGKNINIISESFTSGSLRQYRKKHRGVDIVAIKNWARQILQGLCYLHTHDPPIVHGDLTTENIFVNGNTGEVKIGDIGLASILGNLEFNAHAPQVFEEEEYNNQLVDLHSFGICMLELVTSQCLYYNDEGKTHKHTAEAISVLLAKVKDMEVKQFIDKCLLPTTTGLSAMELLKYPFFEMPVIAMTVNEAIPLVSVMEFGASNGKREFRLRGERTDENSVSLTLRIADLRGQGKATKIQFEFYLHTDTTLSIAGEMAEHLDLPHEDVNLIADLMDNLLIKMVPCWIPSFVKFNGANCTYGDPILIF